MWVLSVLLILLVPPCGLISMLCLIRARRCRSFGSTASNNITATYLESISLSTVWVALCFILAVNFYTDHLYRGQYIRNLVSSDCLSDGTNSTVSSATVTLFPMNNGDSALSQDQLSSSLDDPSAKQHLVSNSNMSVLQSVDMELSVVRRSAKILLLSRLHANSSFPTAFTRP